jgi:hypothetical protein
MGKAGRLNKFARRKEFLISFWGTFLALLGLPSALLTILGMHFSISLTAGLVLFAFSFSTIVNRHRWKTRHLPVEDIIPEDIEVIGRKRICCPCSLKLAEEVGQLAQYYYAASSVSPMKYETLRVKNPYILACLVGPQGDFLGYFDVIPLKEGFAELFLQGRVAEKDITHEDIFAPHEMRLCRHVYISGLAACNLDIHAGRRNAEILVWGMLKYLDHFYSATKPYAFASAVTKDGEKLLRSFKLQLICEGANRIDGHPMYALTLAHDEITKRLACLIDWTLLCSLDWSSNKISNRSSLQTQRKAALPKKKRRTLTA